MRVYSTQRQRAGTRKWGNEMRITTIDDAVQIANDWGITEIAAERVSEAMTKAGIGYDDYLERGTEETEAKLDRFADALMEAALGA